MVSGQGESIKAQGKFYYIDDMLIIQKSTQVSLTDLMLKLNQIQNLKFIQIYVRTCCYVEENYFMIHSRIVC